MEINLKKIIAAIGVAAILICIGGKTAHAAMPQNELLAQIGAVKKQILILQIQLIQIQIAGLQNQLAKIGKTAKFVSLLSPNGGEKIYNDRIFKICWEASGVEKISLALARSETSHIIAENIPAAPGCYDWEVDDVSGKNFKIKIFDAVDQKTQSSSAANFSIFARNDVCDDGTWRGECSEDLPQYCSYGGDLAEKCSKCGCPSGKFCYNDGTCRYKNSCSDGTTVGHCSDDQPKFCLDMDLDLIDACNSCGCPAGDWCGSDSKCH